MYDTTMLNDKLTLRELLAMVPEKQSAVAMTRKQLKDKHYPIAVYTTRNYRLTVFENGYVLAESFKRWTLVRLSDCAKHSGYSYTTNVPAVEKNADSATPLSIDKEMLLDMPWTFRVTLTAEDQLDRNSEVRFAQMIWRHPEAAEDSEYTLGGYYTFEDDLFQKTQIQDALMKLTEKQFDVVQRYFFAGYTQREIGKALGISTVSVRNRLEGAVRKLRKILSE